MSTTWLKMFIINVLLILVLLGVVNARQTVKVYINECYEELTLNDYHNYTGKILVPPPDKIEPGSSTLIEYEYARFPGTLLSNSNNLNVCIFVCTMMTEFGSLLDANVNYYGNGANGNQMHFFLNVNSTGGIEVFLTAPTPGLVNSTGCADTMQNGGSLPSVIGVYAFFTSNQTNDECKAKTPPIDNCKYVFQTFDSNPH